jgi:excisionase family DNA binding protein
MSDTNGNPDVMTLEQAARYLQISKAHLSNIINGKVPGVPVIRHARVGRRVLIRREWACDWLDALGQLSGSSCPVQEISMAARRVRR